MLFVPYHPLESIQSVWVDNYSCVTYLTLISVCCCCVCLCDSCLKLLDWIQIKATFRLPCFDMCVIQALTVLVKVCCSSICLQANRWSLELFLEWYWNFLCQNEFRSHMGMRKLKMHTQNMLQLLMKREL